MKRLRIIFMGSPDFAVPALDILNQSHHTIVGVVTQPDKARGRGQKIKPIAIKKYAIENQISPVLQPLKLKEIEFINELRQLQADLFVVVAFRILPQEVFNIPVLGTINLHPSLLPRYRGAAPINWTIINGERETGITIIKISERVDAGGILLQKKVSVQEDETAGSLHDRLSLMGSELLLSAVNKLAANDFTLQKQDDYLMTPAPKINKETCHISFNQPAGKVKDWIHGLSPYPTAFTYLNGKQVNLYRAKIVSDAIQKKELPGTVIKADEGEIHVVCHPGIVSILELQREGKKKLTSAEFLRGFRINLGEVLD